MTLKEVAQICVMIRKTTFAWKNETEDDFVDIVNAWYECLKDVPYEMAKKAVTDYVCKNNYPPTVADIYKPYKEHLEEQKRLRVEYNNIYLTAISNYPCYEDTAEIRKEFQRITKNSISNAAAFSNTVISFVRGREKSGEEIPPLIEWMKGIDEFE